MIEIGFEQVDLDLLSDTMRVDRHAELLWISVKDRLPEQDEEVIALCDDLKAAPLYKISFAHIVDKTMCQDHNGWNIPNVVYWFPMPKLPKEQEEIL